LFAPLTDCITKVMLPTIRFSQYPYC